MELIDLANPFVVSKSNRRKIRRPAGAAAPAVPKVEQARTHLFKIEPELQQQVHNPAPEAALKAVAGKGRRRALIAIPVAAGVGALGAGAYGLHAATQRRNGARTVPSSDRM